MKNHSYQDEHDLTDSCSVFLHFLKDPVTIKWRHNFCMACINEEQGICSCIRFLHVLCRNILAEIVEKPRKTIFLFTIILDLEMWGMITALAKNQKANVKLLLNYILKGQSSSILFLW